MYSLLAKYYFVYIYIYVYIYIRCREIWGKENKIKESEKIDKYLDPVREPKKPWNMKVMMIPIVVVALGMVPRGLEKKRGG